MKKFLFVLLAAITVFGVTSCGKSALEKDIEVSREDCPINIGVPGMSVTDIYLDGNNVVYEVEVDEDIYDLDELESMKHILAQTMAEALEEEKDFDPDYYTFLKLVTDENKNVVYRYIGDTYKDHFDVMIPLAKLQRML